MRYASCAASSEIPNEFIMQIFLSHLPGLTRISAQASVLIVLVLAVQWICGRRLQPRWRCALWLLVALRLVWPWAIPSPASVFNLLKLPTRPEVSAPAKPVAILPAIMDERIQGVEEDAVAMPPVRTNWLAWLWAASALCLMGGAAANHFRIHRRITRRRPLLDAATLNLLEDCKALMGVRTPVILIEAEE